MQGMQWKDYVRLHNGDMKAASKMYRSNAGPNAKRETLLQNDVSLLSSTFVSRVVIPKTITEVVHVVRRSRHVCVFGSAHSMGGHTLWPNAVRIDMRDMNGVKVSHNGTQVKVGAGITWRDLLKALDKRGLTVRCMQSYADFTVGGSVSVNAHGPSADILVNTVLSFVIVLADGRLVSCSRTNNKDVFECAIGGYGLFGIIVSITLSIRKNTLLCQKSFENELRTDELLSWYDKQRQNGKTCLYTIPVITTGPYAFEKVRAAIAWEDTGVASEPGATTHSLIDTTPIQTAFNTMKRMTLSTSVGVWIAKKVMNTHGERDVDSAPNTELRISMNQMRYQLCEYVTPHEHSPHTFLLFESFIDLKYYKAFLKKCKEALKHVSSGAFAHVFLLSLYVRFVEPDQTTRLSYAPSRRISFVFYFKVDRNDKALSLYQRVCENLVDITISLRGCFYLPYRVCFDCRQLKKAYPQLFSFVHTKTKYDPDGKFMNHFGHQLLACCTGTRSRQ